jgi:hypothetical protein
MKLAGDRFLIIGHRNRLTPHPARCHRRH